MQTIQMFAMGKLSMRPLMAPMHRTELCVVPSRWSSEISVLAGFSIRRRFVICTQFIQQSEVKIPFCNSRDQLDVPALLQQDRNMLCYRSFGTLIQFFHALKLCTGRMASMCGNAEVKHFNCAQFTSVHRCHYVQMCIVVHCCPSGESP